MTAISAAIVELEAWRESLGKLIADLRRHDRAIEATYPPLTVPVKAPTCPLSTVSANSAVAAVVPKPAALPSVAPTAVPRPKDIVLTKPTEAARIDAAVLQALGGGPMKTTALMTRTKATASQMKSSLSRLREQKRVTLSGWTSKAAWSLVPGGTRTASASAATGPALNGAMLETVWNGRKTDPSLLGDRSTRSSLP